MIEKYGKVYENL